MNPAALSLTQQHEAIALYEGGLSAQQVADRLGVGIGAVYYPLRRFKVTRRSAQESNRIRFEAKPLTYTLKERLTTGEEKLKLAAVMLYWAEGYKVGRQQTIDFANSEPDMALLFITFLRKICGVDESKLRGHLYLYEGQDIQALRGFWSELLSLPEEQFIKPYVKKAAVPGPRGPRMTHGLVHVRYCDKKLLRQILRWIDEYRRECVGGGVVNRDWL